MNGMINVENIRWFQSISRMVFTHENQSRLKELKNFKQKKIYQSELYRI